jgi:hypothetical protein
MRPKWKDFNRRLVGDKLPAVRLTDVFVPGGFPRITYVPRDELKLEAQVQDYLDERHKVLSLSGPTKSGKTVLVRKIAPDAIWVSGGDITGSSEFWRTLVDRLDGWIEVAKQRGKTEEEKITTAVEGKLSVGVAEGGAGRTKESSALDERVHLVKRDRPPQQVAADLLRSGLQMILQQLRRKASRR